MIKKQSYRLLMIDNDFSISLIDKKDNVTKISKEDILYNSITKIELGMRCSSLVKLGEITFKTKNDDIYCITISDIDKFIQASIYQNWTKTIRL